MDTPNSPSPDPAGWDALKEGLSKEFYAELNAQSEERVRGIRPPPPRDPHAEFSKVLAELAGRGTAAGLSAQERERLVAELLDEILGCGPLEPLLRDPSVDSIFVDAPDKVYVERSGKRTRTAQRFRDEAQVIQIIRRLVAPAGLRFDASAPWADARLSDGTRIVAVLPPAAVSGPTLTIRRLPDRVRTIQDFLEEGVLTEELLGSLKEAVALRRNIVISGAAGSGKTEFLNALADLIGQDERVITVEESAELRLSREQWVRLERRPPDYTGEGEVSLSALMRQVPHMRPDRIVVGECFGPETLGVVRAMLAPGGVLTTVCADGPREALARLALLARTAESEASPETMREMVASAIHFVVHLSRLPDGGRKCVVERL